MSNLKPVSCRPVRNLVFGSAFAPYNFDDFSQAKGSFHGSFFS